MMNKRSEQRIKIFLILCFLLFSSSVHAQNPTYQLVACAVFQDEAFFLKEWIEFHKQVGVEHFYLYNNLSTDHYLEILTPYIESGDVELFECSEEARNQQEYLNFIQLPTYNQALELAKATAKWAAFIDLDEFLFPVRHHTLVEMLVEYEEFAGLAVNWQIFGTSWVHELPPHTLITETLRLKAPTGAEVNQIVKLIVQPNKVAAITNPHYFEYVDGYYAVNSNFEAIALHSETTPVLVDTVRINHYWFGTKSFFNTNKLPRRQKWGFCFDEKMLERFIFSCNQEYDDLILRFTEQINSLDYPRNGNWKGSADASF